jgi:hypothetical protein
MKAHILLLRFRGPGGLHSKANRQDLEDLKETQKNLCCGYLSMMQPSLLLLLFSGLFLAGSVQAAGCYLSPNGNDGSAGVSKKPFGLCT